MIRLLTGRARIGLVVAAMAVAVAMVAFAQTTEPAIESVPASDQPAALNSSPTGDENSTDKDTSVQSDLPVGPTPAAAAEVEIQRRFNELQRELLDDRGAYIDRWLAVITIALAFFGLVAVVGGYIGFKRFREIEAEARKSVEAAKRYEADAKDHAERIEALQGKAVADVQRIRDLSTVVPGTDSTEANLAVKDSREDPKASPIDKAIANAVDLQQRGRNKEAIKKWRAIAHVVEGSDNDLSAKAWFTVGYLLYQDKDLENSLGAYDLAIHLKPDFAEAYNNRGNAKVNSGKYAAAIADYDKAIHLRPDFAKAFNNRGASKAALKLYGAAIADCDTAIRLKPDLVTAYNNRGNAKADSGQPRGGITDFDEAIHLKPDYVGAYINRGIAKVKLNLKDEARKDFEIALELARNAGDADLLAKAEQWLRDLDAAEGS